MAPPKCKHYHINNCANSDCLPHIHMQCKGFYEHNLIMCVSGCVPVHHYVFSHSIFSHKVEAPPIFLTADLSGSVCDDALTTPHST